MMQAVYDSSIDSIVDMPHSKDIEHCLLGCMINNIENAKDSIDLNENIFYYRNHRDLFNLIISLVKRNRKPDISIILEEIKKTNGKISDDDTTFLLNLSQKTPVTINYDEYVRELKDLKVKREVIKVSNDAIQKTLHSHNDASSIIDSTVKNLTKVDNTDLNIRLLAEYFRCEMVLETLSEQHEYYVKHKKKKAIDGVVNTGFAKLDEVLCGLSPSRLYILGARPAVGKTAFIMNIVNNITQNGGRVGVFSLEMSERELVNRYIAANSEKKLIDVHSGTLTKKDFTDIKKTFHKIEGHKLWIDQQSFALKDIKKGIRRLKRNHDINLIVIDYLQLINLGDPAKSNSRYAEITEISRQLKLIAKEHKITVICLSQLSRNLESRINKTPMLSDLRDSGAIEQDADVVLLLSREKNKALLNIAKNRHGPTKTLELNFFSNIVKFKDNGGS